MRIAIGCILGYATGIVLLTGAWSVAAYFTLVALAVAGAMKLYVVYLPRYHAHIIWKITEAEARLEELNRGQVS